MEEHLTFSIWINRGLEKVKGDNDMGFSLFLFLFTDGNSISQYPYKDLKLCRVRLFRLYWSLWHIFISTNSIIFKVTCSFLSSIIILCTALLFPFWISDELFTRSMDLQALNAEPHHPGAEEVGGGGGLGDTGGQAFYERASKRGENAVLSKGHRHPPGLLWYFHYWGEKRPLCHTQLSVYVHHLQACCSNPQWQYSVW